MRHKKRYQIEVDGKAVREATRQDHAAKYFSEVQIQTGQTKRLIDTKTGRELDACTGTVSPSEKSIKKTSTPVVKSGAVTSSSTSASTPRERDTGDAVARHLRGKSIRQIAVLANALLDEMARPRAVKDKMEPKSLMTDWKVTQGRERVNKAVHRAEGIGEYENHANPGSGRMALGNMIRGYLRRWQKSMDAPKEMHILLAQIEKGLK